MENSIHLSFLTTLNWGYQKFENLEYGDATDGNDIVVTAWEIVCDDTGDTLNDDTATGTADDTDIGNDDTDQIVTQYHTVMESWATQTDINHKQDNYSLVFW